MKRLVFALLLLSVVPLLVQAVSAQVCIYDTIYSADGSELQLTELVYTGSTPRYRMADGLGVSLAVSHYLTRLDFVLIIASAGSYTNVTADIGYTTPGTRMRLLARCLATLQGRLPPA